MKVRVILRVLHRGFPACGAFIECGVARESWDEPDTCVEGLGDRTKPSIKGGDVTDVDMETDGDAVALVDEIEGDGNAGERDLSFLNEGRLSIVL